MQWLCSITIINALPSSGTAFTSDAISGSHNATLQAPLPFKCREPDDENGHKVDQESCAATLALIKADPKYTTEQHWGPRFQGYSWNDQNEHCHVSLNATHPSKQGKGTLETVVARVESMFKDCANPGWGGTIAFDEKIALFVDLFGVKSLRPDVAAPASNQTNKPPGIFLPPSRRDS